MRKLSVATLLILATATTHVFGWTAGFTYPVAGTVCDAGRICPLKWFILDGTNGGSLTNGTTATNGTVPTNETTITDVTNGTNTPNITDIYLFSGLNTSLVRGSKITPNGVDPESGTFDWLVPTTLKDGSDYTVGMEDAIDKTYHYSHYFTIRGIPVTTTSVPVKTSTQPASVPAATPTRVQQVDSGASLNSLSLLVLIPFSLLLAAHV